MIVHHKHRNMGNLTPNLKINSEPIERVTEFNLLGLTIDGNVDWSPHIQKFVNKISRTLGIMNCFKKFYQQKFYVLFKILKFYHISNTQCLHGALK